ncbi:type II secretion system F family protein [Gulosibacter chungangensis]|uniref:Type II secretion system F family protein n=1 Tax=Gulosibacter chungangensis TaxID=979746 RepID=A0A7J5BCG6_9MICO|nr:type II secretion system F family protein [Gulosibacter chungangensis]KAB1643511.1 type II secretion system F family protein [Gulosibacter chungangensis]
MSASLGIAALLGVTLGIGLWTLVGRIPRLSRLRVIDRVAPHVADISEDARIHLHRGTIDPLPVLGTLVSPILSWLRTLLSEVVGGNELVRVRLRQSGNRMTLERFRTEQALWALLGALLGVVGAVGLMRVSAQYLLAAILLPVLCAGAAVALRDFVLRRAAERRIRRIASEYPTVLEFLSLSLAAGEGIVDALIRLSKMGHSELSQEFGGVIVQVRAGVPVATALHALGRDLAYTPLTRTLDHIVTSMERGAPLVEVLRAQAQDARDLAKRELLEESGKSEIRMMIPLVMLLLPITVLFAVYPSYFVLTSTF